MPPSWLPLVLLVACCYHATAVIATAPADFERDVDHFIQTILGCRNIVGMNMAVVQGDQTLLTKGYGLANIAAERPATKDTLFSIASLTKSFTTALLGQILKENGLTWHERVRDLLGDDFYFWDGLRSNRSTLQDLAIHAMGLPSHDFMRMQGLPREQLTKKIRFLRPTEDLRTSFFYSSLMYGLLSRVVDVLSGSSWEEQLQERVLDALGINTTTFIHKTNLTRPDIATPYLPQGDHMRPVDMRLQKIWGELGGSGSILSTAEDMAKYLKFQLREGRETQDATVIDNDVIKETHTGVYNIPQTPSTNVYKRPAIPVTYDHGKYGLGWRDGYYRGWRMLLHTGSTLGYGALMTLLPNVDIGIYMSVNGPDDGFYGRRLSSMYIMDLLLGETPWLNDTSACKFPYPKSSTTNSHSDSARPNMCGGENDINVNHYDSAQDHTVAQESVQRCSSLDDYSGMYGNFAYGNVTVELQEDSLHLFYGELGHWLLQPVTGDQFLGVGQDVVWSLNISKIIFKRRSDVIDEVSLALESKDPPVFMRDLKMSDAPPPPDPDSCGTGSGTDSSAAQPAPSHTLIAYVKGLLRTAFTG